MSTEPLDPARLAEIRSQAAAKVPFFMGDLSEDEQKLEAWIGFADAGRDDLLSEVGRLTAELAARWEHDLANGGCVPKPAYDELAEALAVERARVHRARGEIDSALSCVGNDVLVEGHLENARTALAGDTEGATR